MAELPLYIDVSKRTVKEVTKRYNTDRGLNVSSLRINSVLNILEAVDESIHFERRDGEKFVYKTSP